MTAIRKKGFTLIELLIVIAILGVLAIVVLVAINPVQQLERTRDSGRKSTVTQLGHAVQAYYTSRGGTFINESNTWISDLSNAGEISLIPNSIPYLPGITGCNTAYAQNGWCYRMSTSGAIVYARLGSNVEAAKCPTVGQVPWFVYSTADGRAGLVCNTGTAEPTPGAQTFVE